MGHFQKGKPQFIGCRDHLRRDAGQVFPRLDGHGCYLMIGKITEYLHPLVFIAVEGIARGKQKLTPAHPTGDLRHFNDVDGSNFFAQASMARHDVG